MIHFFETIQNKRSTNEDSFCHMEIRVNHEAVVSAYAIADGMGGLSAGRQYSDTAISLWFQSLVTVLMGEQFKDCSLKAQIETLKEFSAKIFHEINRKLYEQGLDKGIKGGTTLTTVIHFWDTWIIANCGDSPVYALQEGKLVLCSEIQNLAWQMVKEHKTQIGSTLFYQNRNRLLEYLGRKDPVHPHVELLGDSKVHTVLMGTDGAFGEISVQRMEQIFIQTQDNSRIISKIMEESRNNGEGDNQTACLILKEIEKLRYPNANEVEPPVLYDGWSAVAEQQTVNLEPEVTYYRTIEEEPLRTRFLNCWKKSGKRRP